MERQHRMRHLRVVSSAPTAQGSGPSTAVGVDVGVDVDESDRAAYWAQVNVLRAERQRLTAS